MDEKGANTSPFHNLPPELKKTSLKIFLVLFHLFFLDKRKVGGDSCSTETFAKTNEKPKSVLPPYHSKPGPPYVCMLSKPSERKNLAEPKNDKFVAKTYTFEVTKCDEIFNHLVVDGQIIVPRDFVTKEKRILQVL